MQRMPGKFTALSMCAAGWLLSACTLSTIEVADAPQDAGITSSEGLQETAAKNAVGENASDPGNPGSNVDAPNNEETIVADSSSETEQPTDDAQQPDLTPDDEQTTKAVQITSLVPSPVVPSAQSLVKADSKDEKIGKERVLPGVEIAPSADVFDEVKELTKDPIPSAAEIIALAKAGSVQTVRSFGSLPTLKTYAVYRVSDDHVDTDCFPPSLKRILRLVYNRFGVKPLVHSGYRNVGYNRRVGGTRGSYHTKCMAADIKVPGVSKNKIAKFLRSLPGVGGVGTYGCKTVVHVDVGPRRDWYGRCRKRRA